MKSEQLESKRIICEPLSLNHLSKKYVNWLNDPKVNRFMNSGGNYTLNMLEEYLLNVEKKKIFAWAIYIKNENKHIGNIKIDPINYKHAFGDYGIMIGDKSQWGRGFAREASELVIKFCFKKLQLRKINLELISEHIYALKLYNDIGFKVEGIFKNHFKFEMGYSDSIRMAIFNSELNYD